MLAVPKRLFVPGFVALGLTCLVAVGCGSDQTVVTPVNSTPAGEPAAAPASKAPAKAPASSKFKGIGGKANPD